MKTLFALHRVAARTSVAAALALLATMPGRGDPAIDQLKQLSLDELVALDVSTLSRQSEPWWRAPGAMDVVTGDAIRESGALTLPDALRLAAGVHVAQSSARTWAISTRGFNVISANKISVHLDGRSLYTPFFSGVQWDAQDVLMEDIDRIEVARGPVGALWGAYAVNGFIQILTKPAWDTQGYIASVAAGTEDPIHVAVRQGGKIGKGGFYRVYAKYWQSNWTYDASGNRTFDTTDFFQAGFRTDTFLGPNSTLTVQGDVYTNKGLPLDRLQSEVSGGNLLGRLRRTTASGGELTIEGYVEQTEQQIPISFYERRRTASVSANYSVPRGRHRLMVGIDALVSRDNIVGPVAGLDPGKRTFHNAGIFLRDSITYRDDLELIAGVKLEHNVFAGFEWSPTVRAAWTPTPRTTLWAALSRAVRSPVRLDVDLYTRIGNLSIFEANEDVRSETVVSLEAGWRHQIAENLTLDLALFVNDYDHIRSFEPAGVTPLPITFKNTLTAESRGAELTLMFQPHSRLFVKGSYRFLDLEFGRTPESRDIGNAASEGNDPRHLVMVSAHATLSPTLSVHGYVRHASALPNPAVDAYTTADLTLQWRPTDAWEISLSGRNLLEEQHRELITTNSLNEWVHRRVTAKVTWRY